MNTERKVTALSWLTLMLLGLLIAGFGCFLLITQESVGSGVVVMVAGFVLILAVPFIAPLEWDIAPRADIGIAAVDPSTHRVTVRVDNWIALCKDGQEVTCSELVTGDIVAGTYEVVKNQASFTVTRVLH